MTTEKSSADNLPVFVFGPTFLRIAAREWALALLLLWLTAFPLPRLHPRFAPQPFAAEDRIHYDFNNDYTFVERVLREQGRATPAIALGDSFVWGIYAAPAETLTARINERAQQPLIANAGLNGLHPAALHGLVRHYGGGLRRTRILLVFNAQWLRNPEQDLSGRPESGQPATPIQHAELLPQFFASAPAYDRHAAGFDARAAIVVRRHVPLMGLAAHLDAKSRLARRQREAEGGAMAFSMMDPVFEDPAPTPFRVFRAPVPQAEPTPHAVPLAVIPETEDAWVSPENSVQWKAFRQTVTTLQRRGNAVFVYIAPYNTRAISSAMQPRYANWIREVEDWCRREAVPFHTAATLPGGQYGDAGHPTAAGYRTLADALFDDAVFRTWILNPDRPRGRDH